MLLRFVLIGLVAGFFSALFGVGGGIVIVPLLVIAASYVERTAMATSLAAIGLTALAGTAAYALHGHLALAEGVLVGLPAMAGAVFGAALQQRLANRTLSLAFAALLLVIAVVLVLE